VIQFQTLPNDSRGFVHRRIIKGIIGGVTGGPGGAAAGFLDGGNGGGVTTGLVRCGSTPKFRVFNPRCDGGWADAGGTCNPANAGCPRPGNQLVPSPGGPCGPGTIKMPNGDCIALPPTFGVTTPAEGDFQAVAGAFGMPAMAPKHELRSRFTCPPGMVLGRDNLCYPRQVLRRDSKFRKWRPGMRPVLTGGERRGIARARRSVERAKQATASLGVTVRKKKC